MLREKLVSVKVRYSPRTIEVYGALVRTYRKVLGQYNPSEYLFEGQSGGMVMRMVLPQGAAHFGLYILSCADRGEI